MFIRYTNSIINFRQHVGYRRLYFKLFISYTERRITFVENSFIVLILFIDIIFFKYAAKTSLDRLYRYLTKEPKQIVIYARNKVDRAYTQKPACNGFTKYAHDIRI